MAKPINITPVLRGKEASKFFVKLEANSVKKTSRSFVEQIRKDAASLSAITKY